MFVKINDVFKKAAIISFSSTFRLILGIETTSLLEYLLLLMSLYDNKKSTNCISKHDDESGLNRNVKLGHLKVKLAASKAGESHIQRIFQIQEANSKIRNAASNSSHKHWTAIN